MKGFGIRAFTGMLALFLLPVSASPQTRVDSAVGVCSGTNLLLMAGVTDVTPNQCVLPAGSVMLESLYYQNASAVGSTAVAAYPMVRLLAGATPHLEVVVDFPSQIAEWDSKGDYYPGTHSGIGLNYALAQGMRDSLILGAEVYAPASLFASNQTQPKYTFGATTLKQLQRGVYFDATLAMSTSRVLGFGQILPELKAGLSILPAARTEVEFHLGERMVTQNASGQAFGDIGVTQLLRRDLSFTVGIGSSFNSVSNTKGHYLESGLTYKP
jgi:hypothetical protein